MTGGCEWFALCDHPADGVVSHPVLGDVPTCERCATKLDLDLRPFPLDHLSDETLGQLQRAGVAVERIAAMRETRELARQVQIVDFVARACGL